jgi:hypothetical protein
MTTLDPYILSDPGHRRRSPAYGKHAEAEAQGCFAVFAANVGTVMLTCFLKENSFLRPLRLAGSL